MKFLKGLVLSLLGLLLFICLSVFGFMFTLNNTILNPDFVVSELDKLDIYPLVENQLKQQVSAQIPKGVEFLKGFLAKVLDDTFTDLRPWVKEQVRGGVYSFYDYLMGRSQSLSLQVPTKPVIDSLKENLKKTPELKGIPPALVDEIFGQLTKQIPPTIEVSKHLLSTQVLGQLEQARRIISYFQPAYKALIGFILLLILGIILINHQVRGATRGLGIPFLIYGATNYAGIFAVKHFVPAQLSLLKIPQIPLLLQNLLPRLLGDLLAPLETLSLGLLAAGVILIIVSFVYKSH